MCLHLMLFILLVLIEIRGYMMVSMGRVKSGGYGDYR